MGSNTKSLPKLRVRGESMTRLDTFLDAAFAFATSMLVISVGDIPQDYESLVNALKGTPAFAASFACVLTFWMGHRKWRRAFGLEDSQSILISLVLIFVLLVYVYPLRLVFGALFAWVTNGWIPLTFELTSAEQLASLFVYYGIGFAILAAMMALLYLKALRAELKPKLDDGEQLLARQEVWAWGILASTAVVSALFAAVMPTKIGVFAGFVYLTLPVTMSASAVLFQRRIKKIDEGEEKED